MTLKADIFELCKVIAEDYDGWNFVSKRYKKNHQHTELVIHPGWSFGSGSGTAQPVMGIQNKKINKLWKEICGTTVPVMTQFQKVHRVDEPKLYFGIRVYDLQKDGAEDYMRTLLDQCIKELYSIYDVSSERSLLLSMPPLYEDNQGISYCFARILLGDSNFVVEYCEDRIETIRPKRKKLTDKILEHLSVLKERDFKIQG